MINFKHVEVCWQLNSSSQPPPKYNVTFAGTSSPDVPLLPSRYLLPFVVLVVVTPVKAMVSLNEGDLWGLAV